MTTESTSETVDGLLKGIDRIGPAIRERAAEIEEVGYVVDDIRKLLDEGGYFKLLAPKRFGGYDLKLADYVRVIERLATEDGSVGWVAMVINVRIKDLLLFLEEKAAVPFFKDGVPKLVGQGAVATGTAEVVPGGFKLTGKWQYGSGIHLAEYLGQSARVVENGKPVVNKNGLPRTIYAIVPANTATLIGGWQVLGLRGTGSQDYEINDAFVPKEWTREDYLTSEEMTWDAPSSSVGYACWIYACHIAVELGFGRRVLEELATHARKVGPYGSLADDTMFRLAYGRLEAKYRAARAFVYKVWTDIQKTVDNGEEPTTREMSEMRMAFVHLHEVNADAARQAFEFGGGAALRGGALQRTMRDIFTSGQHVLATPRQYDDAAKEILGVLKDARWTMFGLVSKSKSA